MNLKLKRYQTLTENIIRTVSITNSKTECDDIKIISFNMKDENVNYIPPKPGQFVMIWVPGIDEVPMSISGCDEIGNWSITVKNVGECTNAIHNLEVGDFIGVRGPLGNYFKLSPDKSKEIILVGGGLGNAALKYLATKLDASKIKFRLINAIEDVTQSIFVNDFLKFDLNNSDINLCVEFDDATVDGSSVKKFYNSKFIGRAHERLESLINEYPKNEISNLILYACGPEKMIYKIFQICEEYGIELQASLERIMRCGCGLCGLCSIDPLGLLVCKDGPVFSSKDLRRMEDFGKYRRDFTGKKITIN